MGLTKISLRKSVLLNLGDYQNCKIEVSVEAEVDEGQSFSDARLKAGEALDEALWNEISEPLAALPSYRRNAILNATNLQAAWENEHPAPEVSKQLVIETDDGLEDDDDDLLDDDEPRHVPDFNAMNYEDIRFRPEPEDKF